MNRTKPKSKSVALVICVFSSLLCVSLVQTRSAVAAGAVEMQVARIVNSAIDGYNRAMETGEPGGWLKYFTDNVHRQGPRSQQQGKQAFSEYYGREFETYRARWTAKKMVVSGRSAAVLLEWEAVHKATDTPLKMEIAAFFELASSGKFEVVSFYFDTAKLGQDAMVGGTGSE